MIFGPKRGHILFIFETFFKDFGPLFVALIIGAIRGDMSIIYENGAVMVIVLLGPVGRTIQYLCTRYSIDEERLLVQSGWLKKQTLEIPLSTITTVDFSQNILHQIFKAYRLNIDNASNIGDQETKVKMTFGKEDAFAVRELLLAGRRGLDGFNLADEDVIPQPQEGRTVRIKAGDLLLLGALKSKGVFAAELFGIATTAGAMFNMNMAEWMIEDGIDGLVMRQGITIVLLILIAAVFVLAIICGMIGSFIRYYGFSIADNGQAIKIEYGLLTKKRYTIQKNRISGFAYQQSLFMRLFHQGTLQLFAIGYGDSGGEEASEEPILFPLIREDRVRQEIARILPEMEEKKDYYRTPRGSLHYFFYGFGFFLSVILLGVSVWLSLTKGFCQGLWIIGLLIFAYSVCGRILEYKHAAMYAGDENFSMVNGGFKMNTIFVKTSHMENVESTASVWKARKGITTVMAGYIAPLGSSNMTVKNMPESAFEEARNRLIY